MEKLDVLDMNGAFIASYFTDDKGCAHENREHTLIYLLSGELEISDHGRKTVLRQGDCAYMRRDNLMYLQKWIIRKRLEVAHQMLSLGNTRVVDVCYDVGFKNPSHFSRIYKEVYGSAPSMG